LPISPFAVGTYQRDGRIDSLTREQTVPDAIENGSHRRDGRGVSPGIRLENRRVEFK
jgi:hypothetical protein